MYNYNYVTSKWNVVSVNNDVVTIVKTVRHFCDS